MLLTWRKISLLKKNIHTQTNIAEKFLNIQLKLNAELKHLTFQPPVAYIYNPVEYAFKGNALYVDKYCQNTKKVLFVGMNPGPFGMCQTGVPFGEVDSVKNWLGIETQIEKPPRECPNRPVLGFNCPRSEVSGNRLWNFFKKLCEAPEIFFRNGFVYNYCPLAFLRSDGLNLTPQDIKDGQGLEEICDKYFCEIVELLRPKIVVGIGQYAERRSAMVVKKSSISAKVIRLAHPSPRAPNNENWVEKAEKMFKQNDLMKYFENK